MWSLGYLSLDVQSLVMTAIYKADAIALFVEAIGNHDATLDGGELKSYPLKHFIDLFAKNKLQILK